MLVLVFKECVNLYDIQYKRCPAGHLESPSRINFPVGQGACTYIPSKIPLLTFKNWKLSLYSFDNVAIDLVEFVISKTGL